VARLNLAGLSRCFGGHSAVDEISLDIAEGEFVALLGPSGCGKTTLLRLLAGFERADGGTIRFDDELMAGPGVHIVPERRRVGMVFQSYALWPHMDVAQNVGYPLAVQKLPGAERNRRVAAALAQVGMNGYERRRPSTLSGGQRQRVALARCLVMEPRVVLLDEPLANLDVHLRESMQSEFRQFHASSGATMVYVTHDQAEAMALSDRIAVMNRGRIEQVDAPRTLYAEPATAMVAQFVGRGMVVSGEVVGSDKPGECTAEMLGASVSARCTDTARGAAMFCLRAESLALGNAGPASISAEVVDTVFRGALTSVDVRPHADESRVLSLDVEGRAPSIGAAVHLLVRDAWRIPHASAGDAFISAER
jgi:iron(III) transport system ATP-binding protein